MENRLTFSGRTPKEIENYNDAISSVINSALGLNSDFNIEVPDEYKEDFLANVRNNISDNGRMIGDSMSLSFKDDGSISDISFVTKSGEAHSLIAAQYISLHSPSDKEVSWDHG